MTSESMGEDDDIISVVEASKKVRRRVRGFRMIEEEFWTCRTCGKEFDSEVDMISHVEAMTCEFNDASGLDHKRISSRRYSLLRTLISVYRVMAFLAIVAFSLMAVYLVFEFARSGLGVTRILMLGGLFVGGAVVYVGCMTKAESIQLMMDIQDNTYFVTELNLAMAKSLDSIDESLKKKGD